MFESILPVPGKLEPARRITCGLVSREAVDSGSSDCSRLDKWFAINHEDAANSVRGTVLTTETVEPASSRPHHSLRPTTTFFEGADGDCRP